MVRLALVAACLMASGCVMPEFAAISESANGAVGGIGDRLGRNAVDYAVDTVGVPALEGALASIKARKQRSHAGASQPLAVLEVAAVEAEKSTTATPAPATPAPAPSPVVNLGEDDDDLIVYSECTEDGKTCFGRFTERRSVFKTKAAPFGRKFTILQVHKSKSVLANPVGVYKAPVYSGRYYYRSGGTGCGCGCANCTCNKGYSSAYSAGYTYQYRRGWRRCR